MKRGFFGCGIFAPQRSVNVGTLLRSASTLGASFTFTIGGQREAIKGADNTTKSYRHIPHFHYQDMEAAIRSMPYGCPLIAVEICQGATPLTEYRHRERAAYLLGPENGSLPPEVCMEAEDRIIIPHSEFCFNVAVAGSIVMWHRACQMAGRGTTSADPDEEIYRYGDEVRRMDHREAADGGH